MVRTSRSPGFFESAAAPARWLGRVLRDPPLRRNFFAGLLVSLLALVVVYGAAIWGITAATGAFVGGEGWRGVLAIALNVVAIGLLVVFAPVIYLAVAGAIGPGLLSNAYSRGRVLAGAPPYPERGVAREVRVALRGVGWEARRLGRFGGVALALALLGLVPVVGVVAPALAGLLAAHTLAWELLTPHFEAAGFGYREQRRFLRRHAGLTFGLGGASFLLLLVPFAQPLVLHACQAAAGALSARVDAPELTAPATP